MQFIYRMVARFLAKHQGLTQRLLERAQRTPYSTLMTRDGKAEYMRRWWLFNAYESADGQPLKRNWFMRLLPSIRFHEILRADDDEHMHDHPWDAQTLVLRGWYIEEREDLYPEVDPYPGHDPKPLCSYLAAGSTTSLKFGEFHRIKAVSASRRQQTLTLFITFRYGGTWGFKVDGHKVPWREYLGVQ